jgi:DNA-binding response OmpR family regulator
MKRILVVDDDRMIGEMLKFMLGSKGYLPVISNKPEETMFNIVQHNIDVVMLDHFMAGISGLEVCKKLQENENTAGVPILMMSGDTTVEQDCLTAGATNFISKPFEIKNLFLKIRLF